MDIHKEQQDLRFVFYGGAAGILVSATAWLLAAVVAVISTQLTSIITLYIAGMFIYPVSIVVSKLLGRPGTPPKGSALSMLSLETTAILVFCYPIAYATSLVQAEWFFPAMLVFIGVRYLMFTTVYGRKIYWVFGFSLISAGYLLVIFRQPFYVGAFTGSAIEYLFGLYILISHKKESITPHKL